MSIEDEPLPHRDLYTRLKPTLDRGIGVFALRDIPEGTKPFGDDDAPTVRVPAAAVEAADPEVLQMYIDFCPTADGSYIAPLSLNLLTLSWYMNHSDRPCVAVDTNMHFRAARLIRKGEELTVDYTTFSDQAKDHILRWKEHP